jgi:hypothetical protein
MMMPTTVLLRLPLLLLALVHLLLPSAVGKPEGTCGDPAAYNYVAAKFGGANNQGCTYSCEGIANHFKVKVVADCYIESCGNKSTGTCTGNSGWPPNERWEWWTPRTNDTFTTRPAGATIIQGQTSAVSREGSAASHQSDLPMRIDVIQGSLILRHVEISGQVAEAQSTDSDFHSGGAVYFEAAGGERNLTFPPLLVG